MSSIEISKSFKEIPNTAQYYGASWDLQIDRINGITLSEAKFHALKTDSITYFFRVNDGCSMYLEGYGTFNSGDTVFFAGVPKYGSAIGLADSYEKIANQSGSTLETDVPTGNFFTFLKASMIVPNYINYSDLMYLWPGFGPGDQGKNFNPIGNGVLQPVLTYAAKGVIPPVPNPNNLPGDQWWISGQYVNTYSKDPKWYNNFGGDRMPLKAGDKVTVTMEYHESTKEWTQTCERFRDGFEDEKVTFKIALEVNGKVQQQNRCYFVSEPHGGAKLEGAFSLFDITVRNKLPDYTLGDSLNVPQVTGLEINPNQMEFTVGRIVIYSPIFN